MFMLAFYLAVNKLMTDRMQNIFYLIAEHYGYMKYFLSTLD